MQVPPGNPRTRAKSLVALLLTFAAGIIDIVGYITVYHLFVAHMTGNTVHLGNKIAVGDWSEAAKAGSTIFAFIIGSVAGRAVIEAGARRRERTIASVILFAEAVLVLVFVWLRGDVLAQAVPQAMPIATICGLLALLAAAMGLQTATLTRIGPLTIHTTFVTGMLNKFAQAISEWIFWVYDEWHQGARILDLGHRSKRHAALRNATFMSAIWFSYMAGSVIGTWMNSRWTIRAMYLPVLLMAVAAAIDQFLPLSLEEEQEQT